MKSTERHELQHNALWELLRNPRELVSRFGLPVLIIGVAAVVALLLILRASGAEDRKWQRAWQPLEKAVALHSEEQLRSLAGDTKAKSLVRAWADVRLGELLYNKSQQPEYFTDEAARAELLNQAIKAHQEALRIGARWREIVGQATIGLGLCYEDLAQYDLAKAQYDSIISQAKDRFAGTIWLAAAEHRKAFLEQLPKEKIVFAPESPPSQPTVTVPKLPAGELPGPTPAQ